MPESLLGRAQQAVELARAAGATDAWASASRKRDVQFTVRDGRTEQVQESASRRLSVKLYVDGRYAVHSTTDLRPAPLRKFVQDAVALTRALEPDPHRTLPDPALFEGRPTADLKLSDAGVLGRDRSQRASFCAAMDQRLTGQPGVITATSTSRDQHRELAAASSNGFSGSYEGTYLAAYSKVTLKGKGDRRPAAGYYMQSRHLGPLDASAIAERALRRAKARVGAGKGPTRTAPMVVDNLSSSRLIRDLLRPATGRALQQQQSLWVGEQGKKVVSDLLTITDDPLLPKGLASRPFDGEGIAARRLPLFERGVLRNFYVDTYYGRKLGVQATTGEPSNRIIAPGEQSFDALLAGATGGILVTSWLGGNIDPTTGDYSLGAAGHLIENGKVGAPVGEMNITGNIRELFSRLVGVGNDPFLYDSTQCPSLLFDKVVFSGAS